jgi:hypothetical protein
MSDAHEMLRAMDNAHEITRRLAELLRRERDAMAEFLLLLADFDRRRLWMELGHAGLFSFLHRELGLSKGAAHYRKTAVELVQRFPEVVEPLRDGRLCITSIVELAKVLTPENRDEVLPRFFHCSRREAAEVAAAIRPAEAPPRRDVVTALPMPAHAALARPSAGTTALEPAAQPEGLPLAPVNPLPAVGARVQLVEPAHAKFPASPAGQLGCPAPAPEVVEPLTADLRRFHITVSSRFLEKLEAARDARSHARRGRSAEEILEEALDLLLAREAKKRGDVEKPLTLPRSSGSDHVPAHVKREVWRRDSGRCQWIMSSGEVCGETRLLEFDHVVPRARGGPSTVGNLRLLCAGHNQLAARRAFGDAWMDRCVIASRSELLTLPEEAPIVAP